MTTKHAFLPVLGSKTAREIVNRISRESNTVTILAQFGGIVLQVRYWADKKRYEVVSDGVLCVYHQSLKQAAAAFREELSFYQFVAYHCGGYTMPYLN